MVMNLRTIRFNTVNPSMVTRSHPGQEVTHWPGSMNIPKRAPRCLAGPHVCRAEREEAEPQ